MDGYSGNDGVADDRLENDGGDGQPGRLVGWAWIYDIGIPTRDWGVQRGGEAGAAAERRGGGETVSAEVADAAATGRGSGIRTRRKRGGNGMPMGGM